MIAYATGAIALFVALLFLWNAADGDIIQFGLGLLMLAIMPGILWAVYAFMKNAQ